MNLMVHSPCVISAPFEMLLMLPDMSSVVLCVFPCTLSPIIIPPFPKNTICLSSRSHAAVSFTVPGLYLRLPYSRSVPDAFPAPSLKLLSDVVFPFGR